MQHVMYETLVGFFAPTRSSRTVLDQKCVFVSCSPQHILNSPRFVRVKQYAGLASDPNCLPCTTSLLYSSCFFKHPPVSAETRGYQDHHRQAGFGGVPGQVGAKVSITCAFCPLPANINTKTAVHGSPVLTDYNNPVCAPLSLTTTNGSWSGSQRLCVLGRGGGQQTAQPLKHP